MGHLLCKALAAFHSPIIVLDELNGAKATFCNNLFRQLKQTAIDENQNLRRPVKADGK